MLSSAASGRVICQGWTVGHACSFPALRAEHLAVLETFTAADHSFNSLNLVGLEIHSELQVSAQVRTCPYTFPNWRTPPWHNTQFLAQANDTIIVSK